MTTIITKNGSGAPTAGQLTTGELAVDLTNKELYTKDSGGNVIKVGAQGGSTGTFTDLTATSSFTSPGIDDNATSTAITIDAAENVGIGTGAPDAPLTATRGAAENGLVSHFYAYDAAGTEDRGLFISTDTNGGRVNSSVTYNASGGAGASTGQHVWETDGNERMRIDASGNVGIGTSSPNQLLTLGSDAGAATIGLDFETSTTSRGSVLYNAALASMDLTSGYAGYGGQFTFTANGSEAMRIDSSGNVGIGTSSPVSYQQGPVLNIGNTSDSYAQMNFTTATNGVQYIGFGDATSGTGRYQGLISFDHNTNRMGFGTIASTTPNMSINAAGNVGIGTDVPSTALQVKGSAGDTLTLGGVNEGTSTANIGGLTLGTSSDNAGRRSWAIKSESFQTGTFGIWNSSTNTGAPENLRFAIAADGSVGIGDQNPQPLSANAATLTLKGQVSSKSGAIRYLSSDESVNAYSYAESNNGFTTGTISTNPVRFVTSNTERMRLDTSGNLLVGASAAISGMAVKAQVSAGSNGEAGYGMRHTGAAAGKWRRMWTSSTNRVVLENNGQVGVYLDDADTAWGAYSDENLKENISDLGPVLDTVKDFRCVNYSLIATESEAADKVGFIAQDWENTFPSVVAKDEDGTLSMKYTETIPVLLKAIQEQQAMIETLQAEVAALKGA